MKPLDPAARRRAVLDRAFAVVEQLPDPPPEVEYELRRRLAARRILDLIERRSGSNRDTIRLAGLIGKMTPPPGEWQELWVRAEQQADRELEQLADELQREWPWPDGDAEVES